MAKLSDISARTGVSISVVSRALSSNKRERSRVSPKTQKRIQEIAKELDFSRNRHAEFLRWGKNATIGVFLPETPNRLIADQIIGISQEAKDQGFPLSVHFSLSAQEYLEFIRVTTRDSNSGIITYYPRSFTQKELNLLNAYIEQGGKVLMLNSALDIDSIPNVCIDNDFGGKIVAEHFLKKKCRNFASIGEFDGRSEAFHRTLIEHGKRGEFLDETDSSLAGVLNRVLQERHSGLPLGIFTANDKLAMKAMKLIRQHDLKIGYEVLLVGYDDLYVMDHLDPPLTTVHQPFKEQGRLAVRKIIDAIYGNPVDSEKIKPYLVIRESG